jgi:hypothetical protein
MNLKQRFAAYLIPLILICVIALTLIWIQRAYLLILNSSQQNNVEKSTLIQKGITNWLGSIDTLVAAAVEDPDAKLALSGDAKAQEKISVRYQSILSSTNFRTMALVNDKGLAISAAPVTKVGESYASLTYINEALTTGKRVITPPRRSRVDHAPLMSIALPIEKLGVVFVSIPLASFYKDLVKPNALTTQADSLYIVYTDSCSVVAHENQAYVLQESEAQSAEMDLCKQPRNVDLFTYRDSQFTGIFSPVNDTGWQIFVGANSDSIKKTLVQNATMPVIFGVCLLIIMSVVVVFLI